MLLLLVAVTAIAQSPTEFDLGISLNGGQATLRVTGPSNELFVVESSSNLTHWADIRTNSLRGYARDLDFGVSSTRQGFFRTRLFEDNSGCGTFECFRRFQEISPATGPCPTNGPPDAPKVRDDAIPTSTTRMKTIRLLFHILASEDGRRQATDTGQVALTVATLNEHYRRWRIQFSHESRVMRSNAFLSLESEDEEIAMKTNLATSPLTQHNIYVTETNWAYSAYSIFPWDPRSLTRLDGTVIQGSQLGAQRTALTHELGHALGLWHTHHGVAEIDQVCSACYEPADGSRGDTAGDRCADTPATPLNLGCNPPAGRDPCSQRPWPASGFRNFMSYANCRSEFTPQQAGRMHTWINHRLTGWLDNVTPAAPSDVIAAASAFGEVFLAWTDNSWNETTFIIERSAGSGPFGEIATLAANTTSFIDLTAPAQTELRYRIRASNGATPSAYSAISSLTTSPAAGNFLVDFRNITPPYLGTLGDPFSTVVQAYHAVTAPTSIRIQSGTYPDNFRLENKILRLEPVGGTVILGTP